MQNGAILDQGAGFWKQFIEDGQLDTESVLAKGYSEDQLPFIIDEMVKLQWIEGEARDYDTGELESLDDTGDNEAASLSSFVTEPDQAI